MKRIILAVVILAAANQTATAQFRDSYTESYMSMLGYERAMNQGAMELQNMKDARANAKQAARNREIAALVDFEMDTQEHLERERRRNNKRDVIRERSRRLRAQMQAK